MGYVNYVHLSLSEEAKIDYKGTKAPYIGHTVVQVARAAGHVILYLCLEDLQKLGVDEVNKLIVYILATSTGTCPRTRDSKPQRT